MNYTVAAVTMMFGVVTVFLAISICEYIAAKNRIRKMRDDYAERNASFSRYVLGLEMQIKRKKRDGV
jgi:hypothetical protein